jgi:hypothetical protein
MEAIGANGRMTFDGMNLMISRKGTGFLTALNQGLQGDKTIPLRSITAVQLKEPGLTRGYLRLSINGRDPVGGAMEAVRDENAVLFDKPDLAAFIGLRDALQGAINDVASAPPQQGGSRSAADEIEKLASLMERGLLTTEEFTAKKRQLLGI